MSHLSRTNSICASPEENLREYVEKNNTTSLRNLLRANRYLINYKFKYVNETILVIASRKENVKPETIQILIDEGVELEDKCLHKAVQNPNFDILKTLIRNLDENNRLKYQINSLLEGNNILHTLVKTDAITKNPTGFSQHIKLLINSGIDINQGDDKNLSVIFWAAKYKLKDVIRVILQECGDKIDLDTHQHKGNTARKLIIEHNLFDDDLPDSQPIQYNIKEKLITAIKERNENDFIKIINDYPDHKDDDNGESTLLQLSCERGLTEIVKKLIELKVNHLLRTEKKPEYPVEIAASHCYHEIFKLLLDKHDSQLPTEILSNLLNTSKVEADKIDRNECLQILLEKIEKNQILFDLNQKDYTTNTPIHFAIRYADSDTTLRLLRCGSSLACKNSFNKMPIENIDPEIMAQHLDECIKCDFNESFERPEFEVTLDYRSLIVPPSKQQEISHESGTDECKLRINKETMYQEFVPETDVIGYMSKTNEFKHLLMHPVIISFLLLKWHRIRWIFYTNLVFSIFFITALLGYIFSYYALFGEDSQTPALITFFLTILYITYFLLICRELFQMLMSLWEYFTVFDNWIEIGLVIITGMILFIDSPSDDTRKQLSSVALLLAAFALILMVGQHPKFSTYVVMLKTVSMTFFKLLLWYSMLVIAFALSFYILFTKPQKKPEEHTTEKNDEGKEEKNDFFTGPGKSLFKTIVMLTGEFDAGSIDFNTFPIVSKLIFALFVFTITIILLNLLNGLAVSDTQAIKDNAELVGHIARAQHIQHVEELFLNNMLPTSIINFFKKLCCCVPNSSNYDYNMLKPLLKNKVCLFGNTSEPFVFVLPNDYGRISIQRNKKQKPINCIGKCTGLYLDRETNKKIKQLIVQKKQENGKKMHLWMMEMEQKINAILKVLDGNNNNVSNMLHK